MQTIGMIGHGIASNLLKHGQSLTVPKDPCKHQLAADHASGLRFSMNNSLRCLSHDNQMAIDTHANHTVAQAVKNTQETACHQGDPNALVPSLIDLLVKRQKA